jgi:uncharacterized phage protein (TIGR01671 family)
MREIVFRGKRVDMNKWVYGYIFITEKANPLKGTTSWIFNESGKYKVRPETVGQFTGLTDKNGKMIFEGDIVSYEDVNGIEDGIGNVLFDVFYGAWIVFVNDYEENLLADVAYNCEIIGNIHDQKEGV